MSDNNLFLRQQAAVDMDALQALSVGLIGCGSIGSSAALYLGKMGVGQLSLYDPDSIEEHNWSNQLFFRNQIGQPKVDALRQNLAQFSESKVITICDAYDGRTSDPLLISGVDSMKSRKEIWKVVRDKPNIGLYIDARMGLEVLTIYALNPCIKADRVAYTATLTSDEAAHSDPCTARSIAYTPAVSAGIIASYVKKLVNIHSGRGENPIPFGIVFDLATMTMMPLQHA